MSVCVYAGLAGDTDPGRFVSFGLYRSCDDGPWERIDRSWPSPPRVHAIATDPDRSGRVTIGTEGGIFRSEDRGDTWRRLPAPAPGLAVWSLFRHPTEVDVMYAGYEPSAILRTDDDGTTWRSLPVGDTFPDVTAHMPKRVTGIAVDPGNPGDIYASLEIGGLLCSRDGGMTFAAAIDGLYVVEDAVDLHAVAVSGAHPGLVTVTTRVGAFQSADRGAHWRKLAVPALREKGSYCRALAYSPSRPDTLYVGAGNDFDGDRSALFVSEDGGGAWRSVELPGPMKSTVFGIAVNRRHPDRIYCSTKYGGVFGSADGGETWRLNELPVGAGHVFSLALG